MPESGAKRQRTYSKKQTRLKKRQISVHTIKRSK